MKNKIKNIFLSFDVGRRIVKQYGRYKYFINRPDRLRNNLFLKEGSPDGRPLPPPHLVNYVTGKYDLRSFYNSGAQGSECINQILKKNGINLSQFKHVLDFGCGCGRVIRHWHSLQGPQFFGTDYNADLIKWCKDHLTFAKFKLNDSSQNLTFDRDQFDFIYAISVFTHLAENLQQPWMRELHRILRPGGYLFFTVHGKSRLNQLSESEHQDFLSGKLVVIRANSSGTNYCGVFHPEQYIREKLAKEFSIVDFISDGAKDAKQDVYLFRKL